MELPCKCTCLQGRIEEACIAEVGQPFDLQWACRHRLLSNCRLEAGPAVVLAVAELAAARNSDGGPDCLFMLSAGCCFDVAAALAAEGRTFGLIFAGVLRLCFFLPFAIALA